VWGVHTGRIDFDIIVYRYALLTAVSYQSEARSAAAAIVNHMTSDVTYVQISD